MKKLYSAEVSGEFVFVVDLDEVKEDRAMDEAYKYLTEVSKANLNIDNIEEIESRDDIPCDWEWGKPFGAREKDDPQCEDYFECREEAGRLAAGLEELGYELEDSFAEDVRAILVKENLTGF